ncbi:MAG: hypothetical protein WC919_07585 [Candidatus Paceibacterota bacterium]
MASTSQRIIIVICGITKAEVRAALDASMGPRATRVAQDRDRDSGSASSRGVACSIAVPSSSIAVMASEQLVELAHYSNLPRVFLSPETHPTKSNLLCWNCGLTFNGVPRFIALERSLNRAGEWMITGNFCSWACAGTHIVEHYDEHKKWTLLQNLAVVRAQIDECDVTRIKLAPSRLCMSLYSGEGGLTQQQYSEEVARCDASNRIAQVERTF